MIYRSTLYLYMIVFLNGDFSHFIFHCPCSSVYFLCFHSLLFVFVCQTNWGSSSSVCTDLAWEPVFPLMGLINICSICMYSILKCAIEITLLYTVIIIIIAVIKSHIKLKTYIFILFAESDFLSKNYNQPHTHTHTNF